MFRFKTGGNCMYLYEKHYIFYRKWMLGKIVAEYFKRR